MNTSLQTETLHISTVPIVTKFIVNALLCFLFILSPLTSYSQRTSRFFERYSIEDGLTQNSINCILKDHKGFLWFGTQDGLNRYDGYQFYTYTYLQDDTTSLSNGYITCIFEDSKKRLWVGTTEGINLYDRAFDHFIQYTSKKDQVKSLSAQYIRDIYEDKKGNLWVATEGGLKKFDESTQKFVNLKNFSLVNNAIQCIYEDSHGRLWLGTEGGIYMLNREKSRLDFFQADGNLLLMPVYTIYEDHKERIWFGTDEGTYVYDFVSETLQLIELKDFPLKLIRNISQDRKGNFLIGTYGTGLVKLAPDLVNYSFMLHEDGNDETISNDIILSHYLDPNGILWIGTYNGLDKYDESREIFNAYKSQLSEKLESIDQDIWSICEDRNGKIWLGTYEGLYCIDPSSKLPPKIYKNDPNNPASLSNNIVVSLLEDRAGVLWIGTLGGGVNRFNPENEQFINYSKNETDPSKGLSDYSVWSIYEDHFGILWFGTSTGLNRFDKANETFLHYQKNETRSGGLSDNNVWTISEDGKNQLWVGTSAGLNLFDRVKGEFTTYQKANTQGNKLSNNYIVTLQKDSKGGMYLGTHGGGVHYFDPELKKLNHFAERQGLANGVVYSIIEDRKGNVWMSTNKGISRLETSSSRIHNYDISDGLKTNRFNHHAVCQTRSGELIFGSIKGAEVFNPDSIQDNAFIPPVMLTGLKIFNQYVTPNNTTILDRHISETQEITLEHSDYVFTIEFVALSFRLPHKNQYAYILEGFQSEWTTTDYRKREATFTNLRPGTYTFRVKASNNDGLWNNVGTSLVIHIKPPLWQTPAFIIIAVGSVLLLFYGLYRIRIASIEKQQKRLHELVELRTYELKEEKSKVEGAFNQIMNQRNEILEINGQLRQTQDVLKNQKDDIEKAYNNIRILSEIGQEITALLDIDLILDAVYKHVNTLMDASGFGIGILSEEKDVIEFKRYYEHGELLPYHTDSLDNPSHLSVHCLLNQREILINDMDKEIRIYLPQSSAIIYEGFKTQSLIYIPLYLKGKPIGVMTVQNEEKSKFTRQHLTILRTMASYISVAIDNANAYESLKHAHETIEQTNLRIMDSIRYAKTIQKAILPTEEFMSQFFADHFVIFRPKDVVSGDFYWARKVEEHLFIAVADCTGHGVPGAFMSMIGSRLLNEVVRLAQILNPDQILDELHVRVRTALKQDETKNDDGMDLALCRITPISATEARVAFSSAKRPLVHITAEGINVYKGDRRSIGGRQKDSEQPFAIQEFVLNAGDLLFLTSDGYVDQNNAELKKFGTKQLFDILKDVFPYPMDVQKKILEKALDDHQGKEKQRDDITVIGIRYLEHSIDYKKLLNDSFGGVV